MLGSKLYWNTSKLSELKVTVSVCGQLKAFVVSSEKDCFFY
uniref:Uncharacterized protein n=1 Tax=Anguilla anguilla TaxID=7936 RepID=A0A0E9USV3_ANGAN